MTFLGGSIKPQMGGSIRVPIDTQRGSAAVLYQQAGPLL